MAIHDTLRQWRQRHAHRLTLSERGDEPPLRAELFSADRWNSMARPGGSHR